MSLATFVQGISPFGPIFGKELRVTARRKRTYLLRAVYLLLLLGVLLLAYTITVNAYSFGGVAAQNQQQSELGQVFFACFGIFSVYIMGLIGPVLASTAIGSERLHKTLPVLLMTPISAWQIVAGKLFSRLLVSLTLIGLGLPVLALVRLLGGVELQQMGIIVALALTAAVSSAAIGLFFSSLLNRAYAVILLSFGTMFFLYVFLPFVVVLSWRLASPQGFSAAPASLIISINPYLLANTIVVPFGMQLGANLWIWCVATHAGGTAMLLMWSAMILRRRARREGESASRIPTVPAGASLTTPPPLLPPSTALSSEGSETHSTATTSPQVLHYATTKKPLRPAREVADNPILWRELRRPLLPRLWQRITCICIFSVMLGIAYLLLGLNGDLKDADNQVGWAFIFNFLYTVIVLVLASTAIAQEKESDTWTLLLATPIAGGTIVWGKALGMLRRMLWPLALICGHFLVFALAGILTFANALMAAWVIFSFNTIWIATGIYFSLRFDKATIAVIVNIVLALSAYLLVMGALSAFDDADFNYHPGYRPLIPTYWLNFGVIAFFIVMSIWLLVALVLCMKLPRGALGQLMIVAIGFFVATIIIAQKYDWISNRQPSHQVGWYASYFYLAQINIGSKTWRSLPYHLPDGEDIPGVWQMLGFVGVIGLAHIGVGLGILHVTAWKFNALVGRARQFRRLQLPRPGIMSRQAAT